MCHWGSETGPSRVLLREVSEAVDLEEEVHSAMLHFLFKAENGRTCSLMLLCGGGFFFGSIV